MLRLSNVQNREILRDFFLRSDNSTRVQFQVQNLRFGLVIILLFYRTSLQI